MDRIPKLRKGSRGRALVEYHRRRFYLGQFGTPEARAEYKAWVTRFVAGDFDGPRLMDSRVRRMSIRRLAVQYLEYAESCCSPAEFISVRQTVRVVVERFGRFDAASFGAPELVEVQSDMIRKGRWPWPARSWACRAGQMPWRRKPSWTAWPIQHSQRAMGIGSANAGWPAVVTATARRNSPSLKP